MLPPRTYRNDIALRRRLFIPEAMAHPAKMAALLCVDLFRRYTLPGQTVLDPFGGIGTTLVGITLLGPRNVILHELEPRFVALAQASLDHVRGSILPGLPLGEAVVLQGDSRHLPLPDGECAGVVRSPPYSNAISDTADGGFREDWAERRADRLRALGMPEKAETLLRKHANAGSNFRQEGYSTNPANIGNLPHRGVDGIISSPPFGGSEAVDAGGIRGVNNQHGGGNATRLGYAESGTIANLTHSGISAVISSPPYADVASRQRSSEAYALAHPEHAGPYGRSAASANRSIDGYGETAGQIGHLAHRGVDDAIGSPLYGNAFSDWDLSGSAGKDGQTVCYADERHGVRLNIGNIPYYSQEHLSKRSPAPPEGAETYSDACLAVYRECYRVVRPGGVLVLVTGDYVRSGKVVDLASDTIALCVAAGWTPVERWRHEKANVSFWRRLHARQGRPVVPYEDVLVFCKGHAPAWPFAELPPTTIRPAQLTRTKARANLDDVSLSERRRTADAPLFADVQRAAAEGVA